MLHLSCAATATEQAVFAGLGISSVFCSDENIPLLTHFCVCNSSFKTVSSVHIVLGLF